MYGQQQQNAPLYGYGSAPPQQYPGAPYRQPQGGYQQPPTNYAPGQGQYSQQQQQQAPYGQPPYGAPQNSYQQGYPTAPPPQQQHAQPSSICFRFSGDKKTILNSTAVDPWGKTVMSAVSTKKETILRNGENRVIATIDWDHSSPRMQFRGSEVKLKDFMPYDKKSKSRVMQHNGFAYGWCEQPNGDVALAPVSNPARSLAAWRDPNHVIEVDISQEALRDDLLEECLLGAFLMNSGHPFGDVHAGTDPAVRGGILGGIIASMMM